MKWVKIFTREVSLFHVYTTNEGYTEDMQKETGWHFKNCLYVSLNGVETSYYSTNDQKDFVKYIKKKLTEKGDKFIFQINKQLITYARDALKTYDKLRYILKIQELDRGKLKDAISDVYKDCRKLYSIYRFPTLIDINSEFFRAGKKIMKNCILTKDFAGKALDRYETKLLPRLFELLGRYFKIKRIYAETLLPKEIEKSLFKNHLIVNKKILQARRRFYVLWTKEDITRVYLGKKAASIEKKELKGEFKALEKEIQGQVAMRGLVKGKVTKVITREDLSKIKNKDILVTPMTRIYYAPYLKKVSAIVTDEGGITCHAAIISRELGTPCIIGTKIATKVLKDGDLVEVDATNGVVKKLN